MKFFDIVWKEISLIKSQKIALVLIFLYPFLVIGLLGASFTGSTNVSGFKVGFVNDLKFDSNLPAQFSALKEIQVVQFADTNALVDAIMQKEVVVGVRVYGDSLYAQKSVDLYYDNSNLLSSQLFSQMSQAMIQRISISAAQGQLGTIWDSLKALNLDLSSEVANIKEFQDKLSSAGQNLDKLENDLNAIDFSDIQSTLAQQNQNVSDMQTTSTEFAQKYSSFKTSFNQTKAQFDLLAPQVTSYKSALQASSAGISPTINSLDTSIAQLQAAQAQLPAAQQTLLDAPIASLQQQKQSLIASKASIDSTIASISTVESNMNSVQAKLNEANSLFADVDAQESSFSGKVNSASSAISTMNAKLAVFKDSVDEVRGLITSGRTSKTEIEQKLAASEEVMGKFSGQLEEFSKIDPRTLAQPVIFYEKKVFNVDPLGILASNAIVVVLILTCMLLTSILVILERTQNVSLRLRLSPTNRAVFILGKIVGQLIIALVEASIIFAVVFSKIPLPFAIGGISQLGFGVALAIPIWELYAGVALVALSFISLGLLISLFTNNQSTVILGCLLLVVPMLFLSGIVLPLEFMQPIMQQISSFLPLTVANNLLVDLIIKGASLVVAWKEVAILSTIIIAIVLVVISKKDF